MQWPSAHRRTTRLSIRCPCGTVSSVVAGKAVTCRCGRRWDTGLLPDQDLRGLDRLVTRSRRHRLVFLVTMLLVVAALVLVGRSAPLPLTVAAFLIAWWRFCRPWWRQRRQGARTERLPHWKLPASDDGVTSSAAWSGPDGQPSVGPGRV